MLRVFAIQLSDKKVKDGLRFGLRRLLCRLVLRARRLKFEDMDIEFQEVPAEELFDDFVIIGHHLVHESATLDLVVPLRLELPLLLVSAEKSYIV